MTYELQLVIYSFKDLSEALFNILQPEYELFNNSIDIEIDDITMKTKLIVKPGIIATRFDKKSFFSTILGSTIVGTKNTIMKLIGRKLSTSLPQI